VIVASTATIAVSGTIDCSGGAGADYVSNVGQPTAEEGGGGGGGIVHLLAPAISTTGTIDVSGGLAGTCAPSRCSTEANPAAGGGGSGGSGGRGADRESSAPSVSNAEDGEPGYSFETLGDPTPLF
jgi:hypothetical protein